MFTTNIPSHLVSDSLFIKLNLRNILILPYKSHHQSLQTTIYHYLKPPQNSLFQKKCHQSHFAVKYLEILIPPIRCREYSSLENLPHLHKLHPELTLNTTLSSFKKLTISYFLSINIRFILYFFNIHKLIIHNLHLTYIIQNYIIFFTPLEFMSAPTISYLSIDNFQHLQLSPKSPKNRIQRKPDHTRNRLIDDKEKKHRERAHQFAGFYSPKHQQNSPISFDCYQLNHMKTPQNKIAKNYRSQTNFSKPIFSINHGQPLIVNNKQNSISNGSEKSSNSRCMSRLQLELKALTYENIRLKGQNKSLRQQNQSLKLDVNKLTEYCNKLEMLQAKSPVYFQNTQKTQKMALKISNLELEITKLQEQVEQIETVRQQKVSVECAMRALQSVNKEYREELFQNDKATKYLQIQLRTLRKQRMGSENNKKLQMQMQNMQLDNKRLRKMVSDLQSRLKNSMMFDLTPDVSQKNESFLLD